MLGCALQFHRPPTVSFSLKWLGKLLNGRSPCSRNLQPPPVSRSSGPHAAKMLPLSRLVTTPERWDRIADNPYLRCQNGMPAIMDSGSPMQISQEGETIFVRIEQQDVIRTVHMNGDASGGTASPFGRSVGTWDGETLVVTTTEIDWPWFDQAGVPQSEELELVERFSVSDDNLSLIYSITATDPQTFTEPVTLEKTWASGPDLEINPYECTWERDDL